MAARDTVWSASVVGAALFAASAAGRAQTASTVWRSTDLPAEAPSEGAETRVEARAIEAQMAWRARWRLTADLGLEVVPLDDREIGGLPHQIKARPAPSIGVGTRRALLPWLELDLRAGATFAVTITGGLPANACSSYANTGLPADDYGRGGAVLSAGGSLRARPTGALRPFDVSLGVRGYLATLTAAEPVHYRCADPVDPAVAGDLRTVGRPAAVAGVVAVVLGIGARFGPRELIGTTLEATLSPGGQWRDIGARFAVSVTLF